MPQGISGKSFSLPLLSSRGPKKNILLHTTTFNHIYLITTSLGSLLMDLDALAGVVAYAHTGDSVMTVTAAVDRITIEHTLKEICDLELSGQVTYATGRSSMEISLQVAKAPVKGQPVKEEDVLITCAFTMVSLDPVTKM